jgi:hypothetical protein
MSFRRSEFLMVMQAAAALLVPAYRRFASLFSK